jgi:hypothetical protein
MIDMKTYKTMYDSKSEGLKRDMLDERAMDNDDPPEEPFLLLLPTTIKGFGLHNKKWS